MNKLISISFAILFCSSLCLAQGNRDISEKEKLEQFVEDICHELILFNDSLDEDLFPEDLSKYVVAKFKEYLSLFQDKEKPLNVREFKHLGK